MRASSRILAVAVAVVLALGGPIGGVASAQQTQPAPQVTPPPPPPSPPAATQPDLFQETLKSQPSEDRHDAAYAIGAGVATAFLIPGRTITCALGGVVGIGVLLLTFGTGYKAASGVAHEGCGGKWIVRGDDLRPDPLLDRPFEWDRP